MINRHWAKMIINRASFDCLSSHTKRFRFAFQKKGPVFDHVITNSLINSPTKHCSPRYREFIANSISGCTLRHNFLENIKRNTIEAISRKDTLVIALPLIVCLHVPVKSRNWQESLACAQLALLILSMVSCWVMSMKRSICKIQYRFMFSRDIIISIPHGIAQKH